MGHGTNPQQRSAHIPVREGRYETLSHKPGDNAHHSIFRYRPKYITCVKKIDFRILSKYLKYIMNT
jgi:hypothetical protein